MHYKFTNDRFSFVYFKVKRLEKEFLQSKAELECIKNDLNNMQKEASSLKEKYEDANLEKELQLDEAKLMERRLTAADKLVLGLTSERERWASQTVNACSCRAQIQLNLSGTNLSFLVNLDGQKIWKS